MQSVFVSSDLTIHGMTIFRKSITVRWHGFGHTRNTWNGRRRQPPAFYTSKGSRVVGKAHLQNISRKTLLKRSQMVVQEPLPITSTLSEEPN